MGLVACLALSDFTLKPANLLSNKGIFQALVPLNRYPVFTLKTGRKLVDRHTIDNVYKKTATVYLTILNDLPSSDTGSQPRMTGLLPVSAISRLYKVYCHPAM